MTNILDMGRSVHGRNIRADFPLLGKFPNLHYLDNAATTQKPQVVIDAICNSYRHHTAPVHRGLYPLAEAASQSYEAARAVIASFIGARRPQELIFTRSATEAINMVAHGWARPRLQPGDEVWVTRMEHHSNFLPWKAICQATGAHLRIIDLTADGELDLSSAESLFGPRTRLIALTHISNVLGVVNPIKKIIERAHETNIPVLIDAAQSLGRVDLDMRELDADFLAVSAHKVFGPEGIGALFGKMERLEEMQPLLLGGGMVDHVGDPVCTWSEIPARFEAGSPNLSGAVGFAAAIEYLESLDLPHLRQHVRQLTQQCMHALKDIPGCRIYAPDAVHSGILSFTLAGVHAHDVAQTAAEQGVAIRAGHHCCQPLMQYLDIPATIRASFSFYNDASDIAVLRDAVIKARRLFA